MRHLVFSPWLKHVGSSDVGIVHPDVWIYPLDVGINVMPENVLLLPNKRRRSNKIQRSSHPLVDSGTGTESSMVSIVLDANPDFRSQKSKHNRHKHSRHKILQVEMSKVECQEAAEENNERLCIHSPAEPWINLI